MYALSSAYDIDPYERGTLTPLLLCEEGGSERQLLLFPPRYTDKESALAQQLGLARIENV